MNRLPRQLVIGVICVFSAASWAEDRVTIRTDTGVGNIVVSGQVVDWTGDKIKIRSGGDVRQFDAAQVVDVQTVRLEKHVEGQKKLAAAQPDEAIPLLREALADEPRQWMRREILADLVKTDLARGDRTSAATFFLSLLESDENTSHFNLIPLDWGTVPPDPKATGPFRTWLETTNDDVRRLIGASVLLFDPEQSVSAVEVLNRLAVTTDRRIYTLARAQLWRRQVAKGDVPQAEIDRWISRLEQIPETLRGGAHYLIGRAWSNVGNPERAASEFLWLPLVYDNDPRLAAEATVAAARELETIGRTADAVVLYREVRSRFPFAPAAEEAKAAIERFAAEAKTAN